MFRQKRSRLPDTRPVFRRQCKPTALLLLQLSVSATRTEPCASRSSVTRSRAETPESACPASAVRPEKTSSRDSPLPAKTPGAANSYFESIGAVLHPASDSKAEGNLEQQWRGQENHESNAARKCVRSKIHTVILSEAKDPCILSAVSMLSQFPASPWPRFCRSFPRQTPKQIVAGPWLRPTAEGGCPSVL